MKYVVILGIVFSVLFACNNRPNPSMDSSPMMTGFPASSDNTDIELREMEQITNYDGTYQGVLPSASGEGIQTTLTLYDDNSYILQSVYPNKEGENAFEEHGQYSIAGDVLALRANEDIQYYKVSDGYITKLDNNRQEISGELALNYRLHKMRNE